MTLSNGSYNRLKFIALVLLPGFSALYFGLAQIWGLPQAEQVVGTATIVDTFLGLLLKNSTSKFQKNEPGPVGDLIVVEEDGEKYLSMALNQADLQSIPQKDVITLRVVTPPPAQ